MENAFKSFQRVKKGSPNGWKKVPQIKSITIKYYIHKIFLPHGLLGLSLQLKTAGKGFKF